MPAAAPLLPRLEVAAGEVEAMTRASAENILAVDLDAVRVPVAELLREASRLVRADLPQRPLGKRSKRVGPGADLLGANLAGEDLRGAELRGALLIAADLRNADLRAADVIGADFRDADLSGADLSTTLYLTQLQVNAAGGDARTRLPSAVVRPSHWSD
jgi:uncharacterized protein YjbI with pentapeptide repeats